MASRRVAELRHEDYKCWICLITADEPPPEGTSKHNWRRPCTCNLVAHQECLLEWATEVSTRPTGSNSRQGHPICPQCKSMIHIAKSRSLFVALRDLVESVNVTGFQFLFFTTIGGSALTTVYTILYSMGASSIRFVCPPDMAMEVLGIKNDRIMPLTFRRFALIPAIPLMLIFSGGRSVINDIAMFLGPLFLADKNTPPWKFSGPRLTLVLLPLARICYHAVYDVTVRKIIEEFAEKTRPGYQSRIGTAQHNNNNEDDDGNGFNIRFVVRGEDDNEDVIDINNVRRNNNNNNKI